LRQSMTPEIWDRVLSGGELMWIRDSKLHADR
jgi:hypothetical protein